VVWAELLEPSPAPALVLTSTFPNATPRENPKNFVASKAGSACRRKILYARLFGDTRIPESALILSYPSPSGKSGQLGPYQKVTETL
jgi:hypothetical protein